MTFRILYHVAVARDDIPKISSTERGRVKRAIEEKLQKTPEIFGKPLRHSIKGYRALRVGDYRVVFRIENDAVKIFLIAHRSLAYQKIEKLI
ncbi:MAG: type II toxin-antitoxin system RelE/ParE family toxin [Parcubacteria group bacterium]|nr:type II toxin-antitoxin system RelE/ParE family toxin [Parcubacteria group bacterium]